MLRALRSERGLRQIDVASMARVDPTVVRRIELGRLMGVHLRSLIRIAAALQVSAVDLVPGLGVVPQIKK